MANYLLPAGGAPATPVGELRSKDDMLSIDPMYKVKIFNKAKTLSFSGSIPANFNVSLSAQWVSPYADVSLLDNVAGALPGGAGKLLRGASAGLKHGGASTLTQLLTAQYWSGPEYLTLDLPILLDAYADTREEVIDPLIQLLGLCAPSATSIGSALIPPGPMPAVNVINKAISPFKEDGADTFEDNEAFTIEIGKFFRMTPCIVRSVSSSFDNAWEDGTGNPISVDFVLSITSYFAVTREDLAKWFRASQPIDTV